MPLYQEIYFGHITALFMIECSMLSIGLLKMITGCKEYMRKEAIQWNKHSAFGQSLKVHAPLSSGNRDLFFGLNIYQLLHVTHASGESCGSSVYLHRLVYAHACRFSDT